ncbi:DNA helicase RecQ [Metabacillus sp. FJAT-52054]|uniref:DNA helicase RecQ n=1 Tax=Metabacillus sediminis TaxID=3117746 RepID=A0ABZ2NJ60_9BACI
MLQQARSLLEKHYGYSSFRNGQEQAIQSVLEGNDTLCVMPTGGGKSICYQIPALMFQGTSVVISPLISLMKDQVDALLQAGIPAAYINSSLSAADVHERMMKAKQGEYRMLYIAPERLESYEFMNQLMELSIPLVAVDEAHCISQWGHDFRPSYQRIQRMITQLPVKPVVMALTATATPKVREDICQSLNIDEDHSILTGFARENLSFSVVKGQDRLPFLKDFLKKNETESGIIYAATRKNVDQLHDLLNKNGIRVSKYHAGMSDEDRISGQEDFLLDRTSVMVATSAFGMGIDKSNIRYVVHYQLPKNMESYYQEAGRAGRDGLDSECILLYSPQDVQVQRFLIDQSSDRMRMPQELEKLQLMVDYCHTENCLQRKIVQYFSEMDMPPCGRCGNCTDSRESRDVTKEAQMVLSCVIRMGQKRFGKALVAQVLTGSQNRKVIDLSLNQLPTYGIMKDKSAKEVTSFIEFLISQDLIGVEHGTYPLIYVNPGGKDVLMGNMPVQRKEAVQTKTLAAGDPLFEELRAVRKSLAEQEKVPPFVIFSDTALKDMCVKQPETEEAFLRVSGVGQHKADKYGKAFIQAIFQFKEQNPEYKSELAEDAPPKKTIRKLTGNSHLETLQMFKEGKELKDIAEEREISIQTVENHLLKCLEAGEIIQHEEFVPLKYREQIEQAIQEAGTDRLKPIKELLPEEISYFMIKAFLVLKKAEPAQ